MYPLAFRPRAIALAVVLVALFAFSAPLAATPPTGTGRLLCDLATTAALTAAGLATVIGLRDAALRQTVTLPTGAASAYSGTIDLGTSALADTRCLELLISAPAHTTGQLPDTKTLIYTVQHDTDSAFGTVADLYGACLTQTGAGAAGAVAAEKRVGLPSNCKRYVRLKATGVATVAPAANSVATLQLIADDC